MQRRSIIRLASRIDLADETVDLADSILGAGDHARETLGDLVNSYDLACFTLDMTVHDLKLERLLSAFAALQDTADSDLRLAIKLVILCGVRRVWNEHVIFRTTQRIPYSLIEVAAFAGALLAPRALARALPIPPGGLYAFLMRVDGADGRFGQGSWFHYVLAQQEVLSDDAVDDVCRAALDHPSDRVAAYLVRMCIETSMPVDVWTGDCVRRLVTASTTRSRRRRRCGAYATLQRTDSFVALVRHWVSVNAYVAVVVRDLLLHDVLRLDGDLVDLDAVGDLILEVQRRLPYLPFTEEVLSVVPPSTRCTSAAWTTIFDNIRRAPPLEERVSHPVWTVRRHF